VDAPLKRLSYVGTDWLLSGSGARGTVTRTVVLQRTLLFALVLSTGASAHAPQPSRPEQVAPTRGPIPPAHSREFWQSLITRDFTPPAGASIPDLSSELSGLLGSPDPELRDEIAYTVFVSWIYQKRLIAPDTLLALTDQWVSNLQYEIGTPTSDAVFRRSFSALALSVVLARDNEAPVLDPRTFRRVFSAALEYLRSEQDLRGYDPVKGWVHSSAHTADLLKFLGRSRYLEAGDQRAILDGVATKMAAATVVFTHGEDERFARAVLSLINRPDADREAFRAWLTQIRPKRLTAPLPTVEELRGSQNVKNLLSKLEVVLSVDPKAPDGAKAVLEDVRKALAGLF
jgi:hypothetical protein